MNVLMEEIKAHQLLNDIENALGARDSEGATVLRSTVANANSAFLNLLDYDVSCVHLFLCFLLF